MYLGSSSRPKSRRIYRNRVPYSGIWKLPNFVLRFIGPRRPDLRTLIYVFAASWALSIFHLDAKRETPPHHPTSSSSSSSSARAPRLVRIDLITRFATVFFPSSVWRGSRERMAAAMTDCRRDAVGGGCGGGGGDFRDGVTAAGSEKCFDAIGSKWKRVKCLLENRRLPSDNNDKSNMSRVFLAR